ncbi:hypothetical protein BJY52DRAFT_752419 [Lactarius psammicola]|nr:hypothetical protein BJY52DRAFT_752419 [Lactarius psammicola]
MIRDGLTVMCCHSFLLQAEPSAWVLSTKRPHLSNLAKNIKWASSRMYCSLTPGKNADVAYESKKNRGLLVIRPTLQPANLTALLLYWGGQARNAYGRRPRTAPATVSAMKRRFIFVSRISCACFQFTNDPVTTSVPAVDRRTHFFLLHPVPMYQQCPSTVMSCGENAAQEVSSVCECATGRVKSEMKAVNKLQLGVPVPMCCAQQS